MSKKLSLITVLMASLMFGSQVYAAAPVLAVVTPVPAETYDTTPDFTFSSTSAGVISYEGDCSSSTTGAVVGDNKITFNALSYGVHSNCKVIVTTFPAGESSVALVVPTFNVKMLVIMPIDATAPKLTLVSGVTSPTEDITPSITFSSDEAGKLSYEGSCYSKTTDAVVGNNTITFESLTAGTYNNCKIRVTDWAGNISTALSIPSFDVIYTITIDPSAFKCSGFSDVGVTDPDCSAITYVKSIGAMTGNPDGSFDPSGLLQRDQIAKIALQTFKKFDLTLDYCGGLNPFPDVTSAAWAYQYVCRAKNLGVVTGYAAGVDAGFFRPARNVNRAEFLAIILRNLSETMPSGLSYSDVTVDAWFAGYAKYSKDNSLFTGIKLYPENSTSRREVAQILYKLHNLGKF